MGPHQGPVARATGPQGSHGLEQAACTACRLIRSVDVSGRLMSRFSSGRGHRLRLETPQREVECRTLIRGGCGPDPAAEAGDNSLHRDQANAGSCKFRQAVKPLKGAKKACPSKPCQNPPRCPAQRKPFHRLCLFHGQKLISVRGCPALNFQAFPNRLSSTCLSSLLNPSMELSGLRRSCDTEYEKPQAPGWLTAAVPFAPEPVAPEARHGP